VSDLAYDPKRVADENDWDLVLPEQDELFLDIDCEDDVPGMMQQLALLTKNKFVCSVTRNTPSKTAGHRHIVIKFPQVVDDMTRVALQACLGSDRRREILSVLRLLLKVDRPATCFFELPSSPRQP